MVILLTQLTIQNVIWVFATRLQELQVCHKNIPNMIGQLTSVVAAEGINCIRYG